MTNAELIRHCRLITELAQLTELTRTLSGQFPANAELAYERITCCLPILEDAVTVLCESLRAGVKETTP